MARKSRLTILLLIPVCILVLFAMIWRVGPAEMMEEMKKAVPSWIFIAAVAALSSILVRLVRWHFLLGIRSHRDSSAIYLIGQAINSVAPAGTGEIARVYTAKKRLRVSGGLTLAACAIERIYDITFLLSMSFFCLILITTTSTPFFQMLIPIAILIAGYLAVLRPKILEKLALFLESFFEREGSIFNVAAVRLSRWLKSFQKALIKFKRRKRIHVIGFGLTIIIWVLEALSVFLIFKAMNTDVPLQLIIAVISLSGIIGTFSFLPGGLGAREFSFTILLGMKGVLEEVSASTILINRAISYLLLGFGFLLSMYLLSRAKR